MKVSKLIEILSSFNQDADITTSIAEDIAISYVTGNDEYTEKNTPQLFIEPVDCLCCHNYDTCKTHDNGICNEFILEEIG